MLKFTIELLLKHVDGEGNPWKFPFRIFPRLIIPTSKVDLSSSCIKIGLVPGLAVLCCLTCIHNIYTAYYRKSAIPTLFFFSINVYCPTYTLIRKGRRNKGTTQSQNNWAFSVILWLLHPSVYFFSLLFNNLRHHFLQTKKSKWKDGKNFTSFFFTVWA